MGNNGDEEDIIVNGRVYPMWQQFVQRKREWIGGTLIEQGDSLISAEHASKTEIEDITLEPNGIDSAAFSVIGKNFTCAGDVSNLGIVGWRPFGPDFLTFQGYAGHTWGIKRKV